MRLNLNTTLTAQYKSQSQAIRVMTEDWVKNEIFCPNCGNFITDFKNNSPVADFYCENCREEYELKSKKDFIGNKIVDGAYEKMIERLNSINNPSFFFLSYNLQNYKVKNFVVIPKHFIVPAIIEKRKPLSENARRARWVGCNILLSGVPDSGKIFYIKNGETEDKSAILKNWRKTLFLRESDDVNLRGWILDVMNCIDKLNKKNFTLDEIYNFKNILSKKHPENRHIKDKIRQQLQFLRDKRYLEFLNRGNYRLT
jgi:type II restriction enzyme